MNAQTEASIRNELFYLEEQLRRDRVLYEPDNAAAIRRCELLRDRLNSRFTELGDGEHKAGPAIVPANVVAKPEAASTGGTTATKANRTRPRNRKPAKAPPNKLTDRQIEALRLHGECRGNMSEVARRMGVTSPTASQHYKEAHKKLGTTALELARTTRLGGDHLGQGVKAYD